MLGRSRRSSGSISRNKNFNHDHAATNFHESHKLIRIIRENLWLKLLLEENSAWSPRRNALVAVFDDRLWLFGGAESSGEKDVTPVRRFNDVWETKDGIHWTQVSSNMPASHDQVVVFQNQIWLLGGDGVWTTRDGKTWKQTAKSEPFTSRGGFGSAVYDGKLWIFGGVGKVKATNEVWTSADGVAWRQVERAPWFPRGGQYSTVFNDKLWIYGGKTGTTYERADDVWFMALN
jgi:hypothetical protein